MENITAEMKETYYKVKDAFDKEYITGNLINLFNGSGAYDEMQKMLLNDSELLNRVVRRYRKYIEDLYSAEDEFDCLRYAFDDCTRK